MSERPMLSIRAVATRLTITQDTVRRLITTGKLPALKIGRWKVDPDDLDAFIAKQKLLAVEPSPAVSAALCDVPPHSHFA